MAMAMGAKRVVVMAMARNSPRRGWSRQQARKHMTGTAPDPVPEAAVTVVVPAPEMEMTTTAMADHHNDLAAPNAAARASPTTSARACQLWAWKRARSAMIATTMSIVHDDTVVTGTMTAAMAIDDLATVTRIAILGLLRVVRVMVGMNPGGRDGAMVDMRGSTAKC